MELPVGLLLAIVGLGMIIFWVRHMVSGGLPEGIHTLESGGYIAFHVTVELITGVVCLVSGLALTLTLEWGSPIALFASGMLAYTGMNSLAWKEVKNNPLLSVMFVIPTVIAMISGIYLITYFLS